MNYTSETTEYMTKKYLANPTRETVEYLSQNLNKPIKSIIGKLSREGVYRRELYKTKTGDKPITKIEIVQLIAETLELDDENLLGLEKSPKHVLKLLYKSIN